MSKNFMSGMNCTFSGFHLPYMILTVSQTIWIGIMALLYTVLYLSKQFPRQTRLLLLNLTLIDMVSTLSTVLLDSRGYLWTPSQPTFLKLQVFLIEFRLTAHILSTTVLALDRIMSLVFAMKYQIHVTDNKTVFICFTIWAVAVFFVTGALYDLLPTDVDFRLTSDLRFDRYYFLVVMKIFLVCCSVGGYLTVCAYMKSAKYLAGRTVPSFQTKSTSRILYSALLHSLLYFVSLFGTVYIIHFHTCMLLMLIVYRVIVHLSYFTSLLMLTVVVREIRLLFAIVLCSCHRGWSEHLNRIRNELYAPYLKNEGHNVSMVNITDVRDVDVLESSINDVSNTVEMISIPSGSILSNENPSLKVLHCNGDMF